MVDVGTEPVSPCDSCRRTGVRNGITNVTDGCRQDRLACRGMADQYLVARPRGRGVRWRVYGRGQHDTMRVGRSSPMSASRSSSTGSRPRSSTGNVCRRCGGHCGWPGRRRRKWWHSRAVAPCSIRTVKSDVPGLCQQMTGLPARARWSPAATSAACSAAVRVIEGIVPDPDVDRTSP